MNIHVEGSLLDLTPSVITYIKEKIGSLERMLSRFAHVGDIAVFVQLARISKHHRHGEVFKASVAIQLPGKTLRATESGATARTAIDTVRDTLKNDIARFKTKVIQTRRVRIK